MLYLLIRLPVFVQLGDRRSGFAGIGVAAVLDRPVDPWVVDTVVVATLLAGAGFVLGWRFRFSGPLFAAGMLALGSYRGSWGQLLHFENLMVLYLMIISLSPAADAWSIDTRGRGRGDEPRRESVTYGFPIALASLVLVITYVIAGLAKLRYGGLDWVFGHTLRNHVAYAAGAPRPPGRYAVPAGRVGCSSRRNLAVRRRRHDRHRTRRARCVARWTYPHRLGAAAWLMHLGVLAFMLIGFPLPLFFVAFAPLYRVERLWADRPLWLGRSSDQVDERAASAMR